MSTIDEQVRELEARLAALREKQHSERKAAAKTALEELTQRVENKIYRLSGGRIKPPTEWHDLEDLEWDDGTTAIEFWEGRDETRARVFDEAGRSVLVEYLYVDTDCVESILRAVETVLDAWSRHITTNGLISVPHPSAGQVWRREDGSTITLRDVGQTTGEWFYDSSTGGFGAVQCAEWNERAVCWERLSPLPWGPVPKAFRAAVLEHSDDPRPPVLSALLTWHYDGAYPVDYGEFFRHSGGED